MSQIKQQKSASNLAPSISQSHQAAIQQLTQTFKELQLRKTEIQERDYRIAMLSQEINHLSSQNNKLHSVIIKKDTRVSELLDLVVNQKQQLSEVQNISQQIVDQKTQEINHNEEQHKVAVTQLQQQITQLQAELRSARDAFEKYEEVTVKKQQAQKLGYQQMEQNIVDQLSAKNVEIQGLKGQIAQLQDRVQRYRGEEASHKTQISSLLDQNKAYAKEADHLRSALQQYTTESNNDEETWLSQRMAAEKKLLDEIEALKAERASLRSEVRRLEAQLAERASFLEKAQSEKQELRARLDNLEKLNQLQKGSIEQLAAKDSVKMVDGLQKQLVQQKQAVCERDATISRLTEELGKYKRIEKDKNLVEQYAEKLRQHEKTIELQRRRLSKYETEKLQRELEENMGNLVSRLPPDQKRLFKKLNCAQYLEGARR